MVVQEGLLTSCRKSVADTPVREARARAGMARKASIVGYLRLLTCAEERVGRVVVGLVIR